MVRIIIIAEARPLNLIAAMAVRAERQTVIEGTQRRRLIGTSRQHPRR